MTKTHCKHPDPAKQGTRIDRDKYDEMKRALLKLIPRHADGIAFGRLREVLPDELDAEVYSGASVSWYLTTIKLDLEARGLIERVPGKSPQHLRRVR